MTQRNRKKYLLKKSENEKNIEKKTKLMSYNFLVAFKIDWNEKY